MTMNLKNEALQKLYDTLVNSTISMSPYTESPIDKAFAECDDQLSESVTFEHIKDLQNRNDVLEKSNATLLGANLGLASTKEHLEKDLDDAKKQLKYFTLSRDDWRARAKHAEKEVEELKKELHYEKDALVTANADRTNLQEACDKLSGENKKLKARTDCLRYEVEWYRKHYKEQSDKIKELKSRLNGMCGDEYIKKLQDDVEFWSYQHGQTDLWDMMQMVRDVKPDEFDPECETLGDILDMDLEDFLDAYEKRKKEKEKEQERIKYMRDYLERFCTGRLCYNCPLHTGEFDCWRGKWLGGIRDEDVKRHYEKARKCSKRMWHGDATAEKIKFEPWSCTLEAKIEVNRDLLNKVCGIVPGKE